MVDRRQSKPNVVHTSSHPSQTQHRHSNSTTNNHSSSLLTSQTNAFYDDDEKYPEPVVPIAERVKGAFQTAPQRLRLMALNAMSRRTVAEDFMERLDQANADPFSFRNRMWILLELPQSSREARSLQFILVVLVVMSIFSLYTQTILKLTPYGESTDICGLLLSQYCSDKTDPSLDPGCFTQAPPPLGGVL